MVDERDLVHVVGSVPLADSEQVFRTLAREFGPYVRRLPDGETGERIKWIVFQQKMLQEHPAMEPDPQAAPLPVKNWDGRVHRHIALLRMKQDADPDSVLFDTGYDRAAIASYADFVRLRGEGVIPAGTRFQIALPTPMASGLMYVSPNGRDRYLKAYERALLGALAAILDALPHGDLAIQFDVCQEVLMLERYFGEDPAPYRARFAGQFARLGAAVPEPAELGFHLCYGSPGDENLVRPRDAGSLVDLMNDIGDAVRRPVDFIHVPVPRVYTGDSFFAPLGRWKRRLETRLYLGLVTRGDDAGNAARIAAARRVVSDFGIASECGWGRTDPARLPDIFADHRKAAKTLLTGQTPPPGGS